MKKRTEYVNPMEWVGEAHNAGVRYVIGNLKLNRRYKPDPTKIKKLVAEYLSAAGIKVGRVPDRKPTPDLKKVINSITKKGLITKAGSRYVLALLTLLNKELPLTKLLSEIEGQERAVAKVLRGRDLLFFQALASVGRHSAQLWAPVEEGGEDFGHSGTGANKEIDWGEVREADYIGLTEEGIDGAILYSVVDILHQLSS